MAPIVSDLRAYIRHAASLPEDQNKAEVRLYAALITVGFALSLIEPIFYLYAVPQAMVFRVASLAPSAWCVAASFGLCLVAMVPHMMSLLFCPETLHKRWPRRFAAYATFGSAVTWLYLANLALPMDAGRLEWAYALRAIGSIVVGVTYGYSLNAQQGRELLNGANA